MKNANNATHYVKLGKKRRESSIRNYNITSPRVIDDKSNQHHVMTIYNLNILFIIRLCLPAPRGFARCLQYRDPMFKGLYFNIHTCLCFLFWKFQLSYVSVYLLPEVSPDVYTLVTPCSRVSISILIRVNASCEYACTMFIQKTLYSVCTSFDHMAVCVLQQRLCPYLFHQPDHVLTYKHLHQDFSIQIDLKGIHVNKSTQNKMDICPHVHIQNNEHKTIKTIKYTKQ